VGLLGVAAATLFVRLLEEPYGVATAMGFNGLFVAVVLIVVVSRNYTDFATLVQSRQVLAQRTAEAVQLFEENRELAIKDALTGLPNRRWFFAELSSAVDCAFNGQHAYPVVAVIDLDGFKPVNDLHGHSAGDRILVEVAARLAQHETTHVRVARLGGDEFGIILTDIRERDDAPGSANASAPPDAGPTRTAHERQPPSPSEWSSSVADRSGPCRRSER